jgi:plasmid stabilization system protein ParE
MQVILKKRAENGIFNLIQYLVSIGYPLNAEEYLSKIESFIFDLSQYHHIYKLCEREAWHKRGYKCAVFDGKYIIPYKVQGDKILVMNFIHGSRIH